MWSKKGSWVYLKWCLVLWFYGFSYPFVLMWCIDMEQKVVHEFTSNCVWFFGFFVLVLLCNVLLRYGWKRDLEFTSNGCLFCFYGFLCPFVLCAMIIWSKKRVMSLPQMLLVFFFLSLIGLYFLYLLFFCIYLRFSLLVILLFPFYSTSSIFCLWGMIFETSFSWK